MSRVAVLLLLALSACATPGAPRAYFDEDAYARYYATQTDRVLRVERDGTVLDVTCLPPPMVMGHERPDIVRSVCPDGRVETLGTVQASSDGWDLSPYAVAPETGTCKAIFAPFKNEWLAAKRHSCWNRVWEVPASVLVYPGIVAIVVGVVTAPIWLLLI